MYDPEVVRLVFFLIAAVLYVAFIVGFFYAVYLLAGIRARSKRISQQLDEVLARMSSGDPGGSKLS